MIRYFIFKKHLWHTIIIALALLVSEVSCTKDSSIEPAPSPSPNITNSSVTHAYISTHPWRLIKLDSDVPVDENNDGIFNTNLNMEYDSCRFLMYYVFRPDSMWEEHLDNVPCGGPFMEAWSNWFWLSPDNDSLQMAGEHMLVTKLTQDTLVIRTLSWENSIDTTATITIKYVTGP